MESYSEALPIQSKRGPTNTTVNTIELTSALRQRSHVAPIDQDIGLSSGEATYKWVDTEDRQGGPAYSASATKLRTGSVREVTTPALPDDNVGPYGTRSPELTSSRVYLFGAASCPPRTAVSCLFPSRRVRLVPRVAEWIDQMAHAIAPEHVCRGIVTFIPAATAFLCAASTSAT